MLIIEGTDLVGKTTFCNDLVAACNKEFEWPVIYDHFSRLPSRWNYYGHYLPYITRYTVQDRFHMSELVYGLVCRGNTFISPERFKRLDALCLLEGSMTVIITATPDLIKSRWRSGEMFNLEQVLAVNDAYLELTGNRGCTDATLARTLEDYQPEFHHHIHCTVNQPFPTEEWLKACVKQWRARLCELEVDERTI